MSERPERPPRREIAAALSHVPFEKRQASHRPENVDHWLDGNAVYVLADAVLAVPEIQALLALRRLVYGGTCPDPRCVNGTVSPLPTGHDWTHPCRSCVSGRTEGVAERLRAYRHRHEGHSVICRCDLCQLLDSILSALGVSR